MILGDNTYYVSSSATNDCPHPCHPLSYYITNTTTYFTSNATFIFMEGEHLLDGKGLVQVAINNVDNLTLRGHSDTKVTIKCSSNTHGLVFSEDSIVTIYGIAITGCGQQNISPLLFINITSLYIHHITLYNNTCNNGGTLYIRCVTDTHITITNSAFSNNTVGGNGGGLNIHSGTGTHNNITIINSAFTNNTVGVNGGGLSIFSGTNVSNDITIANSAFTNNAIGTYGGGLNIFSGTNVHNDITITNSAFTNNTIGTYGGGMYINSGTDIHNNITITNSAFNNTVCGGGSGLNIHSGTDIQNNITIANSAFSNNTVGGNGGGLKILSGTNVHNDITIANSAFTNNAIGKYGGGMYINSGTDIHNNITITNSAFSNTVCGGGGGLNMLSGSDIQNDITIDNSAFSNNTVGGNGGGLNIFSGTNAHNDITIANSAFTNNTIGTYGGGMYINSGTDIHNNITITNSAFSNTVCGGGGGLNIFSSSYSKHVHNNITIANSAFTSNTVGSHGGGLNLKTYPTIDVYNNITITNSAFTNNKNGGLTISSSINNNITITNSRFINNKGCGVYLLLIDSKVHVMFSQVTISKNAGSGILSFNHVTIVFTEGQSIVANNSSPTDGGGIYLAENSYLTTSNGGHVNFINNTAHRYGGAIYSSSNDDYLLFTHNVYEYTVDHCTVYDLSATFINNSAVIAGDQLYGGVFVLCQGTGVYDNYLAILLSCKNVPDTIKKNLSSAHPLSVVSSYPLVVCPCVNGTVDCTKRSLDRQVYPGQIFHVSLVTVGLCEGVNPGTVVIDYDEHIHLISTTTTGHDYTSTSCSTLYYIVKLNAGISSTMIKFNAANSDILNNNHMNIHLSIVPCPLGLKLDFTTGDCVCNDEISHIFGIICNISWMPYPIQQPGNNWISHQYKNCTIAHSRCPFDYCTNSSVKLNLNESDLQCNYNRSGILCGQCIQGLSLMLGSNRCANCTDATLASVFIFIIAAVAGIVLVILLIVLNLTVSVGSINGLLFYANLVKLNESVFFSKGNTPIITQFISWCNLDLGIEYCFIDGLNGYIKTWLQFVFPVYIWILVILIIVGCQYSSRLSRLCGHNVVPVLATLILMSYTKLSRTVTNALMMNTLQCGEYKWNVWNVDGNIDYLGDKHIVLYTVSLLLLVTGLVYTGLVFSSQWLQRYSGKCCKSTRDPVVRLKPLIDAYTGPFKDKYRFWTGLCLIVRLILTVVFSFTTTLQSELNNYIIVVTAGAMGMFLGTSRAYKNNFLTALEIFSLTNLTFLSLMMILFTESYRDTVSVNVMVSVSVSIEILLFVIIVTVHCYLAFNKMFPSCKLYCCKTCVPSEGEQPIIADDIEDRSPATAINRREELLFEFHLNEEQS